MVNGSKTIFMTMKGAKHDDVRTVQVTSVNTAWYFLTV